MIINKIFIILLFTFLVLFSGCYSKNENQNIENSFYYWKTTINLQHEDELFFQKLKVNKLFVRFFDVIRDREKNSILPSNKINIVKDSFIPEKIIPVVYITEDVLNNLNKENISNLSQKILIEIDGILKNSKINKIEQIQIDCDWTLNTKDIYFELLKEIKKNTINQFGNIILSSTIRLHQIKYFKETGIPPVDRGTLMVYNTSSPYENTNKKSILDIQTAKNYLKNINSYPLKFDIAVPDYSWVIQYDKFDKFIRLINDTEITEIENNKSFKKEGNDFYTATEDTFIFNKRIMKYDKIKIEKSNLDDCTIILNYINSKIKLESLSVIIYHYNNNDIRSKFNEKFFKIKKVFNFY